MNIFTHASRFQKPFKCGTNFYTDCDFVFIFYFVRLLQLVVSNDTQGNGVYSSCRQDFSLLQSNIAHTPDFQEILCATGSDSVNTVKLPNVCYCREPLIMKLMCYSKFIELSSVANSQKLQIEQSIETVLN